MFSIKAWLKHPMVPLCFVILIDHIGFGIFYPILVPVFMDGNSGILGIGADDTIKSFWYGVTLAVFPISLFFGATILGSLSDCYGRKRVLCICLIGAFLSYLISGIAVDIQNLTLLILSRVVSGLTAGSMPIAQAAIMDLSTERERAENLSIVILSASFGFLLGPLIGGFFTNSNIISWFNYSTPLYFASILALLNLITLKTFRETFIPKPGVKFHVSRCLEYIFAPITMKPIRYLAFLYLVLQLGWSFYFQYIAVFLLKQYQYKSLSIGLFMSLMGIGFASSYWVLRILSKRLNDLTLTLSTLVIVTISMFLTVIEIHPFILWVCALILGMFMAVAYSMIIKLFSLVVSNEHQGFIMGVAEAIVGVTWALTPLIATYLETVSLLAPLIVATSLLGLSALMFCFWKGPKQVIVVDLD